MRVYQTLTIFGFRNAKVAELRVERSPNGKAQLHSIWHYHHDGFDYARQVTLYEAELTKEEKVDLLNKADDEWIKYWSVDAGELLDWATNDMKKRGWDRG